MEASKKTVLIADDRGTTRSILCESLGKAGYNVLEAETGHDALRLASSEAVNLLILDVLMPKGDGLTILERLKAEDQTSHIPVMMCTAKGLREDILKAMQLGASDYIVKPFNRGTIVQKVKNLIGDP